MVPNFCQTILTTVSQNSEKETREGEMEADKVIMVPF
jgi:hypothetical protein